MNARAIVTATRIASALFRLQPVSSSIDLGRRRPHFLLLGLDARLAQHRLVRHQREDQAREVHQEQDDRDFKRQLRRRSLRPVRDHPVDRRNDQSERSEHQQARR